MKDLRQDNGEQATSTCVECGGQLQADEGEHICSACLVIQALTPEPELVLGNEGFTSAKPSTTWADEFPHLEIGERIRRTDGVDVFQAIDPVDGNALWLLVATAAAVQEGGGLEAWEQCYGALRQLNHSTLARVVDCGDLGERYFVLFQAPSGDSLESLEESLAPSLLELLMQQVGEVFADAKAVGVSLKLQLSNVFISSSGPAVVIPLLKPSVPLQAAESPGVSRSLESGNVLGHYTLIDKIGEGGFAEVWLANQEHPVRRQVALKIIKEGMDTQRVLARFEAERQALALLDHPNIARVYDAGSTDTGRPYFIMEAVEGQPIDVSCDQSRASLEERLRLIMAVCQAVQHAHQKGIIHRDLKPSNVLVARDGGGEAVAKVIDFGIAKAIDQSLSTQTICTREHQIIGTPDYMSPEQRARGGRAVDSRSDVYSLGILLYELLTGSTPFRMSGQADGSGTASWQRGAADEREVPKPSTRLAEERGKTRDASAWKSSRESFPRELDWIVLRALESDPERRYQSATQLGEDLHRFLNHEAVEAGPPTKVYQMRKFARRHRVAVASGLAVVSALVIGMGLALAGFIRAEAEKERVVVAQEETKREAEIATAVNAFLQNDLLGQADPHRSGEASDLTLRAALDRAAATVDERFADKPEVLASLHLTLSSTYDGLSCYEEAEHHAREVVRLREMLYGWDHADTLWANSQLAQTLNARSRFDEALKLHERVLEGKRRILGEEHASTLRTRRRIAESHGKLGDYAQAEAGMREVLAVQKRVLGEKNGDTVSTAHSLARWLFEQESRAKRAEALGIVRETLEMLEKANGPDHLDTLGSVHLLATMLHQDGKPEEAEPLHRRLLERRREIFGDTHAYTLTCMNNLASCLGNLGRDAEAIEIYRELVPLQKELFGVRDAGTLACLNNLGTAFERMGKQEEALAALEEVYEVGSELLGTDHPKMLTTLGSIARNHAALGDTEKATEIYRRLLPDYRQVLGETHPQTLTLGNNLALHLSEVGDNEGARQVWQDMVTAVEKDAGPNDVRLAELLVDYGFMLYEHMKRAADAVPVLKRAETIYLEALGPDDKKTKDARLHWLTSRRNAGERLTQEEMREAFRLFEEVNGQTMGEFQREMRAKEGAEAE